LTGGVDRCGAHVFEVGWKPGPRPWTQLNAFSCDLEVELNPLGYRQPMKDFLLVIKKTIALIKKLLSF